MSWVAEDVLQYHCQELPRVGPFSKQELNTSTGSTQNFIVFPAIAMQELRPFSKQEPNTEGLSRKMLKMVLPATTTNS
jgi:hypothetical protein